MPLLLLDNYKKNFTNRFFNNLTKPKIKFMGDWNAPKYSVYHYLPAHAGDKGPTYRDFYFKNTDEKEGRVFYIDKLEKISDAQIRLHNVDIVKDKRVYQRQEIKIKTTVEIENAIKNPEQVLIISYVHAERPYNYPDLSMTHWHRKVDLLNTVVKGMEKTFKDYPLGEQFFFIDLPNYLPAKQKFDTLADQKNIGPSQVKPFEEWNTFLIAQLYLLFFTPNFSEKNLFAYLSKSCLEKINIVFREKSGYFTVLNLGTALKWRKSLENPSGQAPLNFRALLLKFINGFLKVRDGDPEEVIAEGDLVTDTHLVANDEDEFTRNELRRQEEARVRANNKTRSVFISEKDQTKEDPAFVMNKETEVVELDPYALTEAEKKVLRILETQLEQENSEKEQEVKEDIVIVATKPSDLYQDEAISPEEANQDKLDTLLETGELSPGEYRRLTTELSKYKNIEFKGMKLADFIKTEAADVQIKPYQIRDIEATPNKDMLQSSMIDFDAKYVKKQLEKDILSACVALQKGGFLITDVKSSLREDSRGLFNEYKLDITPIKGKKSTISFTLPYVNSEGNYTNNGSEYRLRKQKTDIPIRKISPHRVVLTSSYGKIFIDKSEKKVYSYEKYITQQLRAMAYDKNNTNVRNPASTNVFYNDVKTPELYSTFAKEFRTFIVKDLVFYWDYKKRLEKMPEAKDLEKDGQYIVCGSDTKGGYVLMDWNDNLFLYKDKEYIALPSMERLLGLNPSKSPIPIIEMVNMGVSIPLGVILAYKFGFSKLIKMLGVEHRIVEDYQRKHLGEDEYAITFKDRRYVFKRKDKYASLILYGFNVFKYELMDYQADLFDLPDVYFNLIESKVPANRYLVEIDLMFDLFIDPITLRILQDLGEPTTFKGLLFKSAELLLTHDHPEEVSAHHQRIRGYERYASNVYSSLIRAIRQHNGKIAKSNSTITINPNEILFNVLNDPSSIPVNGLNPFQSMRQQESVTYTGTEGRGKETMVKRTRRFDKGDIGVISETTADSGDVGISVYTTANPAITTMNGVTAPIDKQVAKGFVDTAKLFSSVYNTSPGLDRDDPKRISFASIHADANVPCNGYHAMPLRTGYDAVIPYRVGSNFAVMARQDGIVSSIDHFQIKVKYKDGEEVSYPLQRQYGKDGDLIIAHNLVTELKVGQKFLEGDCITYNEGYFQKDPYNNKELIMRYGVMATTALMENNYTLEDSSMVTQELAEKLKINKTDIKVLRVSFDASIHDLVMPGTVVDYDTSLCTIEDAITAENNILDEDGLDLLKEISNKSPKAKKKGVVENIEIFYNGDISEMSNNLKSWVEKTDRLMIETSKRKGVNGFNGKVHGNYLVEGRMIEPKQAVIKIYITGEVGAGVGDKAVFANQMKTTFGSVMKDPPSTEDGTKIDAIFGERSINARIVASPYIMGTTNHILVELGKLAHDLYFEE